MRYLITIEYFGKNYSGWQFQENALSVQQVIEEKIELLLKEKIKLVASGRTDKGAHALAQKAHFDTDNTFPMKRLPLAVNCTLPEDIRIMKIEKVDEKFHAQYSAKRKTYLYKFYISSILSPTRELTHAQIIPLLDFEKMKQGAKMLVGTHNFLAFSSTGSHIKKTVRTVNRIDLAMINDEIFMEVEGNGFLYNMVRIIAGTLVYLGKEKLTFEDIAEALVTGDRKKAGKTFPAHALYLKEVSYED